MEKMKKVLVFSIVFILCLANIDMSYGIMTKDQKITPPPEVIAKAAVVMDAKSGEILFEKNGDDIREQASTTKIMTALLAVENLPLDTIVTIDRETSRTQGGVIHLQEGERITIDELIYGLMLKSANDAAVALGKAVGGTEGKFAKMMNRKAEELGLENTNFKNASGMHADGHYTSAKDLAEMSRYAMKNHIVKNYGNTIKHTIPATNMSEARKLINTNHLLHDHKNKIEVNGKLREMAYEGANGLKTGHTTEAGYCLVATAERGNSEFIVVVLDSGKDERYRDSIALFDWAFENYSSLYIMSRQSGEKIPVKRGNKGKVAAAPKEDVYMSLPMGADENKVTHSIKALDDLKASIKKGDYVANLEIKYENELIKKIPFYAEEDNERGGIISFLRSFYILQSIVVFGIAIIIVLLAKLYSLRKKRRELEEEEEEKRLALELEMKKLAENRKKFMNYK